MEFRRILLEKGAQECIDVIGILDREELAVRQFLHALQDERFARERGSGGLNGEPLVDEQRLVIPALERINLHVGLGRRLGIHHGLESSQLVGQVVGGLVLVLEHDRSPRIPGGMSVGEAEIPQ